MSAHAGKIIDKNVKQEDGYLFETEQANFSLLGWFKEFTASPMALKLARVVKDFACHVGLSKKQHMKLNQLALGLQNSLATSEQPLTEESLIAVLRGDLNAREGILNSFNLKSKDLPEQRTQFLLALKTWYQSLSITQQQIVESMQQRAFRLSMG